MQCWQGAATQIQRELHDVRTRFGADWAVVWGPIPLDPHSPFTCVLFEDRDPKCATALGMAVPIVGNRWAETLFREGGALSTDGLADHRLRLHAFVIRRNRIVSLASGAYRRDGQICGVVEVYATSPMRFADNAIADLSVVAERIAAIVNGLPKPSPTPQVSTPPGDPLTGAALHDLKSSLAAQSLLVSSFEKELKAAAADPSEQRWSRLGSMIESLAVLRDSVMHATELARVMTLGTLAPGTRFAIDLHGLVKLALAAVPHDLRERITVSTDAAVSSQPVIDAPGLLRAIVNLVQNAALAIHRIPAARASVQLRREGDDVLIEVRDDGPGIPLDIVDGLFQAGVTSRENRAGHGYGLYSARQAVEAMSGTLTLYSVPGHGARFTIRLPLRAMDS